MKTIKHINGFEVSSLVNYILENSNLNTDQFTFTLDDTTGYSKFVVVKDNKLIKLGEFYYEIEQRKRFGITEKDLVAMTKFLDLCLEKIENPTINVPTLVGNPDHWDKCYKS